MALYFVKRDAILLAATAMIVMAAMVYLAFPYALAIGAAIFFGLKSITANRKAALDRQAGEGFCAECGNQIKGGRCAVCDDEPA